MLSRHFRDSSSSLYEKLHSLPVAAWEEEFPVLDACSRESHRIAFTMTSVRRNVGDDINICGGTVKWGDFLAYPMTEVHLNPDIYPEPLKYDPGRWLRPDPAPKVAHPFLGWGAGRHPCAGMKVAKLEMKWVMAVFMMRFDYELVDESGKFPRSLPVPNRNDAQVCCYIGGKVFRNWPSFHLFPRPSRFALSEGHITLSSRRLWNRRMAMRGCTFLVLMMFSCLVDPLISTTVVFVRVLFV